MMKLYECDLHCHTIRSDGNDTPSELIENAANLGLKVIAITDHDIQPPLTIQKDGEEIDTISFGRENGVEVVLGYEFSCDTYVDDVHILGFNVEWNSNALTAEVNAAKNSKANAYRELCHILTKSNYPIDFEKEILQFVDGSGELKTRNPDEVQRKHIFELLANKGFFPTWQEAKLFVRDNPELNIKRRKISPFAAIDLIKSCGGTAVLAHPFLIDEVIEYPDGESLTRDEYIAKLIDHGLDGIEACYPYSKTSYKGKLSNDEIEAYIKRKYRDRVAFFSGGSDYHADFKKGVANPRCLGEAGISWIDYQKIKNYL